MMIHCQDQKYKHSEDCLHLQVEGTGTDSVGPII
jgi:hypothetical protein